MSTLEKWQAEAREKGWTLVAQVDWYSARYRHDACKCEKQARIGNMRDGLVACQHCKKQALQIEATAKGWTFVAKSCASYAIYSHNICGHAQQVNFGKMREGRVECQNCKEQAWRNAATAQGWEFVAQVKGRHHALYKHLCGHKQQIRMGDMRTGEVACHGCGESWATKPSNLYLLDITTACGQRFLKLGMARIVARRAALYGLAEGAKIKVLYAKAYATGAEACKVEKQLHKSATTIPCVKRFKGAKKLMDSGHTECYEYSSEAAGYLLLNLPN